MGAVVAAAGRGDADHLTARNRGIRPAVGGTVVGFAQADGHKISDPAVVVVSVGEGNMVIGAPAGEIQLQGGAVTGGAGGEDEPDFHAAVVVVVFLQSAAPLGLLLDRTGFIMLMQKNLGAAAAEISRLIQTFRGVTVLLLGIQPADQSIAGIAVLAVGVRRNLGQQTEDLSLGAAAQVVVDVKHPVGKTAPGKPIPVEAFAGMLMDTQ